MLNKPYKNSNKKRSFLQYLTVQILCIVSKLTDILKVIIFLGDALVFRESTIKESADGNA